jgi:hypothetical protein
VESCNHALDGPDAERLRRRGRFLKRSSVFQTKARNFGKLHAQQLPHKLADSFRENNAEDWLFGQ